MIGQKVFRSAGLMGSAQLIVRGLDFLALLVAARFLLPEDFGLVALSVAVLVVVNSVTELPVGDALVQRGDVNAKLLETAFTLSVLRGCLIASVLWALASPVAVLLADPRLESILRVVAVAPLVQGFASPNMLLAVREVNYLPQAICQVSGKLLSTVLLVVLVWKTGSYWALVLGSVSHQVITALITHLLAPFRLGFRLEGASKIVRFAGWVTVSKIIAVLNQQGDRLFLGVILGKNSLGRYAMAGDLSSLVTYSVVNPVIPPLFAGLSRLKDDPDRLARAYCRGQQIVATCVLPFGFGIAALAESAVPLCLGSQWVSIEPLLWCLGPAAALQAVTLPVHSLAMAHGQPKSLVKRELVALCVRLPTGLYGAWQFGLMGAAIFRTATVPITLLYNLALVRRLTGVGLIEQIQACSRSFVAAVLMAGTVLAAQHFLPVPETPATSVLRFVILIVFGALVYLGILLSLWHLAGRTEGAETWALGRIADFSKKRAKAIESTLL